MMPEFGGVLIRVGFLLIRRWRSVRLDNCSGGGREGE